MSDRGMKKWAPYRSLPEKDINDIKMKKNRSKIEKPLISNEEAEEINELILNYKGELIFTIYNSGELINVVGEIKKIDPVEKIIYLKDRNKINLRNIVKVKKHFCSNK